MTLRMLVVGLLACGGGSDPDPVERGDFDARLARAMCERYARCGRVEDLASCEERERALGLVKEHGLGTRYDASLEAGRVSYDAEAAAECVEFLGGLGCDEMLISRVMLFRGLEYAEQCRFIRGALDDGQTCQRTTECRDGSFCDAERFSCGGVCRRGPAPEPVETADACPPGTVNNGGRCDVPAKEGGRCGFNPSGPEEGICEQDFLCDSETRKCRSLPSEGDACDSRTPCVWSLTCKDGRCQKLAGEGGACTADRFHRWHCRDEFFCDADDGQPGTCRPKREAGAACRHANECGAHLGCVGVNEAEGTWGTCQPLTPRGAPCQDIPCDWGLSCAYAMRTCQPSVRLGERCDPGACIGFGACVDGICQEPGPPSCP
jgi:hypothetical protein